MRRVSPPLALAWVPPGSRHLPGSPMFVAVACPQCGKPFQVAEADVGRPAACPWCKQVVAALPTAQPVGQKRPLSLDEAIQLPPVPPPAKRGRLWPRLLLLAAVCLLVGGGTYLATRAWNAWANARTGYTFEPPDGGFVVRLPGEPVEESVAANPLSPATRGGKRFVARRRAGGFTAVVGWQDLDPERAKATRAEDAIAAERDRRAAELGGTPGRGEVVVKLGDVYGRQVEYDTPEGPWVERYVYVPEGPRPRLYFVGGGPDRDAARGVIESFRLK